VSDPYDEVYDEGGEPRPHYAEVLAALGDPASLAREVKRRLTRRGVSFGAAPEGIFALDPVPRILTEPEWSELQAGIAQRLLALEAFVADVYGEGRVFEAGVLTREDVEASPHYEPAMRGAAPARWVSFAGLDVARCADGRFRVIEDNARMAAGMAYAVVARETLRELLEVQPPQPDLSLAFGELALALRDAAPPGADEPRTVILSEGPSAAGWWEHERLARELCAPVVTLDDLEHRDGRLVAWLDGRARAVDVVYLRTKGDRFTCPDGSPTAVGEALLAPSAAGVVSVVNAPGAGVADDKLVHGHVDELVRFYLDQESLLPSVPSRRVAADDDLDGLVVKPRGEMGGDRVVIWEEADEDTRARVREEIAAEPDGWIGQELVRLSVHPTVVDGALEPRHVDLRPYALLSDDGVRVLPAAISRVALERGSLVVNSGQGGGAKDTWVEARSSAGA
jgi:carboxylate-amine ligase